MQSNIEYFIVPWGEQTIGRNPNVTPYRTVSVVFWKGRTLDGRFAHHAGDTLGVGLVVRFTQEKDSTAKNPTTG